MPRAVPSKPIKWLRPHELALLAAAGVLACGLTYAALKGWLDHKEVIQSAHAQLGPAQPLTKPQASLAPQQNAPEQASAQTPASPPAPADAQHPLTTRELTVVLRTGTVCVQVRLGLISGAGVPLTPSIVQSVREACADKKPSAVVASQQKIF